MKGFIILCSIVFLSSKLNAQIQKDKVFHFVAGAVISAGSSIVMYKVTHKKNASILIGIGAGCLAGAAKELYDSTGRGDADSKDLLWSCAGASLSSVSFVIKF